MKKYLLAATLLLLATALPAHGRERVSGWCEQGGNDVTVGGLTSTEDVQESFASCTVTVYDVGTLDIASIFSDDSGTVKANPFTASSTGFWFFLADDARYDIRFSGGGIVTPFTIGDILLDDTKNDVTTISAVSFSATPTIDVSLGSIFTLTLTANVTSSTISNPVTGQRITLRISQDATGGWTFVYPVNTVFHGVAPTIALAPSAITSSIFYFDGTNWQETTHAANEMHWPEVNEIVYAHMQAGADAGAKIANCIARLPTGGGTCDAKGLEGAQTAAATLTISKPVQLLLGAATFTWAVQPGINFAASSDGSSLICTNKSKITFIDSIPDFADLVRATATSRITIRGCDLDGNGANAAAGQQNTNIRILTGSTDILIQGNIINDSQGDGILIADGERVTIVENIFFDNGRQGVTLFGPTINAINVSDNDFRVGAVGGTGGSFVHGEGAIAVGAGVGIVVADNLMDGLGISFSTTGDPWKRVTITGNEIFGDATGDPIIIMQDVQDFTITGNVIKGDSADVRIGIQIFEITAVANAGRGAISGNTIMDTGSHGIIFTGTLEPALGSVTISNNIIANPGGNGIFVDTDWPNLTIQGNVIYDCTSQGILFADSQYFTIAGNTVRNCGTGAGIQIDLLGGTATGIGTVYGNVVSFDTIGTTKGIQVGSNVNIDRILIFGNDVADSNTPLNIGASATNIHSYMNRTVTSGTPIWTSEFELDGDFNHDGTNAGFYGVAPVARPGATDEIKAALALIGLLTDAGASPLDLDGGLLTA
ncbi:hypothetical protein LCGC14_1268630, partial [marine sediment metagenome]